MNKYRNLMLSGLLLVIQSSSAFGAASSPIILDHQDVTITEDDLYFYLRDRLDPSVYEAALNKPDAVMNSVVNLYLLRRVIGVAQELNLFESNELSYFETDGLSREAVARFVEAEAEAKKAATDWEALAKERYLVEAASLADTTVVRVKHILVKADGRSFEELVSRVAEVRDALRGGQQFGEVAKQYSDDPSVSANEGDLGFIAKGATVPAFESVAFSMTVPQDISEPFLTTYGVHIVQFIERREERAAPFEEIEQRLIAAIKKERENTLRAEILAPYRAEPAPVLTSLDQSSLAIKMIRRLQEPD